MKALTGTMVWMRCRIEAILRVLMFDYSAMFIEGNVLFIRKCTLKYLRAKRHDISSLLSNCFFKKAHIGGAEKQREWRRKREREREIQTEGREGKGREHVK